MDRGKYGSKIHLITERTCLPLSVGVSGANVHDSQALIPLVQGRPPIRSRRGRRRRGPGKLHGDEGYDYNPVAVREQVQFAASSKARRSRFRSRARRWRFSSNPGEFPVAPSAGGATGTRLS